MELKDFISKTLSEITDGVQAGQQYMHSKKSYVDGQFKKTIKFDVNVTYEDNVTAGGSGKITVASMFTAGLNKETKQVNTNYNRIQFELDIKIFTDFGPEGIK